MIGLVISFLARLLGGLVTAWNKSKDVTIAGYASVVGLASAQAEYMRSVIGHPLSPPSILCYTVALYDAKCIAYDNIISYWFTGRAGYTAPLFGDTAYAHLVILSGMFAGALYRVIRA